MQNNQRISDRVTDAYRQLLIDVTAITAVLSILLGFCLGIVFGPPMSPVKGHAAAWSAIDTRGEAGAGAGQRRNYVSGHQ